MSLTKISIPDSVTEVGENMFVGCENLEEIIFGGTKSEWEALTADKTGTVISDGVTVICSDGNY